MGARIKDVFCCSAYALSTSIFLKRSYEAGVEDCMSDIRQGRRGRFEFNQSVPAVIEVGNDGQFEGLQPRLEDVEPVKEPAASVAVCIPQRPQEGTTHLHEETE